MKVRLFLYLRPTPTDGSILSSYPVDTFRSRESETFQTLPLHLSVGLTPRLNLLSQSKRHAHFGFVITTPSRSLSRGAARPPTDKVSGTLPA